MKKIIIRVISAALPLLFLWGCEDDPVKPENNCELEDGSVVELVYPKGGETFYIGDTVNIQFKIDTDVIPTVAIKTVFHADSTAYSLTSSEIAVVEGDRFQCMNYKWIVGEGFANPITEEQNFVALFIHYYNSMVYGKLFLEQSFTVKER